MTAFPYRIALGSYAYRYAVGYAGFTPPTPMDALALLKAAHQLGYQGIQLGENLNFAEYSDDQLLCIKEQAADLGLFVEVGMKELDRDSIRRHLKITTLLESSLLRIVIGDDYTWQNTGEDRQRAIEILCEALPECREKGVTIGIENRFDLYSDDLVHIIEEVNDHKLRLILDTSNGVGFIEHPLLTLEKFAPYLVSLHLKDFIMVKVEAEYRMRGTPLGEGWLDIPHILTTATQSNPNLSIVLEMTVSRQPDQSLAEILAWEQGVIEKSTEYLKRTLLNPQAHTRQFLNPPC